MIDMEHNILKNVDYKLVFASSLQILYLYCEHAHLTEEEFWLARYFLECSLSRHLLASEKGKFLAAGALILSLAMFGKPKCIADSFLHLNNLEAKEVKRCCSMIWNACIESKTCKQLTALERKYSHTSISKLTLVSVESLSTVFADYQITNVF